MVSTVRKQSAKWFVVGAILLGVQQSPAIYNHVKNILPGHGISGTLSKPANELTPEQAAVLSDFFKQLQKNSPLAQPAMTEGKANPVVTAVAKPEVTIENVISPSQSLRVINDLSATVALLTANEKSAGGNVIFYMSDLTNHLHAPISATSVQTAQSQLKSGYMIAIFAKTQTMILAPVTQNAGSAIPTIATIVIERAGHEPLYDVIANGLTTP